MVEIIKRYKREVIVGVVVSLITAFIIKAGDWILYNAPATGKSVIAYCENIVYTLAATQSNNSLGILLMGLFLGLSEGVFISLISRMCSAYIKVRQLEKRTNEHSGDDKKAVNSKVNQKEINKNESSPTSRTKELKKLRKKVLLTIAELFLPVIILYVFVIGAIVSPANLWGEFERDITMIYPYVEENHIYRLKSDWVCMRSKDDYNKIYEFINGVKEEFSLPN